MPIGWQRGINSLVFFAATIPATVAVWNTGPFFHEFVVACPISGAGINTALLDYQILGGYDLGQDYPELKNHMLLAVTEMKMREEIDALAAALAEVGHA